MMLCEWEGCTEPKANQKNSRCRWCTTHSNASKRAASKRHYHANKESILPKKKQTRDADPEKFRDAVRAVRKKRKVDPARVTADRAVRRAYETANAESIRATTKAWGAKNQDALKAQRQTPEGRKRARENQRDCTYGLAKGEFDARLAHQNGMCLVCGGIMTLTGKEQTRCHVDHDHATGKVRGLLCAGCNQGLGHFQDDVSRLLSAVEYLMGVSA